MVERARIFIWSDFSPSPLCIRMKTIELKCPECGNPFHRPLKEHRRSLKLRRPEFCSGTCSTAHRNKELTPGEREKCYNISQHAGNRQNEFSPFKPYLSKWRYSMIKHKDEIDIDAPYLKSLWERQKGICPYTGIKMILPRNSKEQIGVKSLKKASLDRIDSSRGYLKGNVEFVCCAINMAKNSFTRKQMKEFLAEIGGATGN